MHTLPHYVIVHPGHPLEADSKWHVSWWEIPGMTDYDSAYTMHAFFATEEEAAKMVQVQGEMPPEMADMEPVENFLARIQKIEARPQAEEK
jgi:hypothetical protein